MAGWISAHWVSRANGVAQMASKQWWNPAAASRLVPGVIKRTVQGIAAGDIGLGGVIGCDGGGDDVAPTLSATRAAVPPDVRGLLSAHPTSPPARADRRGAQGHPARGGARHPRGRARPRVPAGARGAVRVWHIALGTSHSARRPAPSCPGAGRSAWRSTATAGAGEARRRSCWTPEPQPCGSAARRAGKPPVIKAPLTHLELVERSFDHG